VLAAKQAPRELLILGLGGIVPAHLCFSSILSKAAGGRHFCPLQFAPHFSCRLFAMRVRVKPWLAWLGPNIPVRKNGLGDPSFRSGRRFLFLRPVAIRPSRNDEFHQSIRYIQYDYSQFGTAESGPDPVDGHAATPVSLPTAPFYARVAREGVSAPIIEYFPS